MRVSVCACALMLVKERIVCEGLHACKCVVCTFGLMCTGADPWKKRKKKKGCVPQAIPPSPCSPLLFPPLATLSADWILVLR